ncbi:MAG: T9SS type A sorting domain-containing protein, partial [Candidatus Stygibacter australis]|nr:T9SS type A sorting domain-containing protein [Candidatus Stygibacter australis]
FIMCDPPAWDFDYHDYEYSGFIWSNVIYDNEALTTTDYQLGCFVGNECRGIAQTADNSIVDYTDPFDQIAVMPMVYTNNATGTETVTFMLYNEDTEEYIDCYTTTELSANMVLGSGLDPFMIRACTYSVIYHVMIGYHTTQNFGIDTYTEVNNETIFRWRPEVPIVQPSHITFGGNGPICLLNHPSEANTGTDYLISDSGLTDYYSQPGNAIEYEDIDNVVQHAVDKINLWVEDEWSIGEAEYDDAEFSASVNVSITFVRDQANFQGDADVDPGYCDATYHLDLDDPNYIESAEIYINCTPEFLVYCEQFDIYPYWDISLDSPLDQEEYEVYLLRTLMHEMLHAWGVGHIDANGVVMHDSQDGFYSTLGTLDIRSLQKLYDPNICNPVSEEEILELSNCLTYGYPNPFNPTITIVYKLAENIKNPLLEIFNIKGQLIKEYYLDEIEGENAIIWNGKDKNDNQMSSGVYFYRLRNNGKIVETRKMTLIK